MFRTLAIVAALSAAALPAAAESVTVNIAGLDAKTAHAKIVRAAEQACGAVLQSEDAVVRYYGMPSCVSDAVSATEAKMAAASDHRFASVQNTGR
jgi:hypothetical protein